MVSVFIVGNIIISKYYSWSHDVVTWHASWRFDCTLSVFRMRCSRFVTQSPYKIVTVCYVTILHWKIVQNLNPTFQQGSYLFTTYRPVEQLRQLLLHSQGYDSEAVQAFFKLHRVRINVNFSHLNLFWWAQNWSVLKGTIYYLYSKIKGSDKRM